MRATRFAIAAVAAIALLATPALAGEDCPSKAAEAAHPVLKTALYKVPDLTADLAKQLVKGLAEFKGIVSAKPDLEKGILAVTFDAEKADPKKIEPVLSEISSGLELDSVGPADAKAAASGCGKCPSAAKCSKEKDK